METALTHKEHRNVVPVLFVRVSSMVCCDQSSVRKKLKSVINLQQLLVYCDFYTYPNLFHILVLDHPKHANLCDSLWQKAPGTDLDYSSQ